MIARHFITLTQPWATLMAIGAKRVETRGWRTNFRGPLAIHAAKGFPGDCRALCELQPFEHYLRLCGYHSWQALPVGEIIAVVNVADCHETEHIRHALVHPEPSFGNYADGRFAFVTDSVRELHTRIPMRGALGIRPLKCDPITEADLK